jgi:hypothetical protein
VLAWAVRFDAATRPGLQAIDAIILRVSPDGRRADSVGVLPFTTVQPLSLGGGRGWRVALGAGQLQAAVGPTKAYFNSPTTYLLYVLGPKNDWSRIQQSAPVRLSRPSDAEAIRQRAVDNGASPELMAQIRMVDTLPAILFAKLTSTGRLFVLDGTVDSPQQVRGVTVFSPAGNAEGHFTIPASLMLLTVSDSLVVLTERDPEDAPSVSVFRLLH